MFCKVCNCNVCTHGPRCHACHKQWKTCAARKLRAARRSQLLMQNDKLLGSSQRICTRCKKIKTLSSFRTTLPNSRGKRNKICDQCLTRMYVNSRADDVLDYKFWRNRAYSLNSVARQRLRKELGRVVTLNDLPFVFKPQDLAALFLQQQKLCKFCCCQLTAHNTTVDHYLPLSRSGKHDLTNVVLTCRDCNHLKHTRTGDEFVAFVRTYAERFKHTVDLSDKEPKG